MAFKDLLPSVTALIKSGCNVYRNKAEKSAELGHRGQRVGTTEPAGKTAVSFSANINRCFGFKKKINLLFLTNSFLWLKFSSHFIEIAIKEIELVISEVLKLCRFV